MSNYPNFPQHELDCGCGCDGRMDDRFMLEVVVPMRQELGFPFTIPKGGAYRCAEYDRKENGAHEGRALDVLCNSRRRYLIIEWLMARNMRIKRGEQQGRLVTRIGINNGSIHFDDRENNKATNVMWDYYG